MKNLIKGIFRSVLLMIFPPIAVWDRGCLPIIIVSLTLFLGWIPAMIVAFIILHIKPKRKQF